MILQQSSQSGRVVLEAREGAVELRVEGTVVGHENGDATSSLQRLEYADVAIGTRYRNGL